MNNAGKVLLLAFFWAFVTSVAVAQEKESVGCFVEGECVNSMHTHYGEAYSAQECLDFCKSHSKCDHWTYYGEENFCFTFDKCEDFSSDTCTNCISGDKDCRDLQCFESGYCDGVVVIFGRTDDTNACLNLCKDTNNCNFWSYNTTDLMCVLTSDCPVVIDDECPSCLFGNKICEAEIITTTLGPSTTMETTLSTTSASTIVSTMESTTSSPIVSSTTTVRDSTTPPMLRKLRKIIRRRN